MDYLSYSILTLQVAMMVLLSYMFYMVFRVRKSMTASKVVKSEHVSVDSEFRERISEVLDAVEIVRSDINELRVLIDEISRRIRAVEQAVERITSESKAMASAGSTQSERPVREAPLFLDLNEPAVRQIYEYLKKRREEREKKKRGEER